MSRDAVVNRLTFSDSTQKSDLLNGAITQDDLLKLVAKLVQQGVLFEVTSVVTDHGDDSALGPHSHKAGYAIDIWCNAVDFPKLLHNCIYANPYVTKIGLGGIFQQGQTEREENGTVIFFDNDQDHIHLQTS